ncbi:MAG: sce7726 family protein [Terriglobia bacterium]
MNRAPKQATDAVVRAPLRSLALAEHTDAVLIEEFGIWGGSIRADLVVLNGVKHGYEIKTARDSLRRLPGQIEAYGAVFEFATLVSADCHIPEASKMIPPWWGIIRIAEAPGAGVQLERTREATNNPHRRAEAVAALLWRPEAMRILTSLGLSGGIKSKPMRYLTWRLASEVPLDRLSTYVREALRARGDWRSAGRLKQYDVTSRRSAKLLRCRPLLSGHSQQ